MLGIIADTGFLVGVGSAVLGCIGVARSECAARCVFAENIVIDSQTYGLIAPQMAQLSHCYRVFITDQTNQPNLVDETLSEVWQYKAHAESGAILCEDNSGIEGTGEAGEGGLVGPAEDITCYDDCQNPD
jgi:hypothetical protein